MFMNNVGFCCVIFLAQNAPIPPNCMQLTSTVHLSWIRTFSKHIMNCLISIFMLEPSRKKVAEKFELRKYYSSFIYVM